MTAPMVSESERRLMAENAKLNQRLASCQANLDSSRNANTRMRAELRKRRAKDTSPWVLLPWRGYVS